MQPTPSNWQIIGGDSRPAHNKSKIKVLYDLAEEFDQHDKDLHIKNHLRRLSSRDIRSYAQLSIGFKHLKTRSSHASTQGSLHACKWWWWQVTLLTSPSPTTVWWDASWTWSSSVTHRPGTTVVARSLPTCRWPRRTIVYASPWRIPCQSWPN